MESKGGQQPKVKTPAEKQVIAGIDLFQYEWSKFIHRVKVHELLRCLENEQKKLKILREHTHLNELLDNQPGSKKDDVDSLLFTKSLDDEKNSAEALADEIRHAETDNDFVSRSALSMFKTNIDITDEQFEQILQLCKDRVEQKQLRDAFTEKKYRERYLHNASERRKMLYEFLNSHFFNRFLLLLIAVSTLIIVLLTFESVEIRYSYPLRICDAVIISIFLVEAICKISIYKTDYFRNLWNLLDMAIIVTHFVEVVVDLVTKLLALNTDINKSIIFRLLKSLRSLRLLRTIKFLPNLQIIVSTIIQSIISLSSIAILMAIIIVVFAVVGRGLFKEDDPGHFETIWVAMLTLFQLLTLDDWFDLPDDYEADPETKRTPYVVFITYLFIYILFEYFVFLNLFVAVLVDNFQLSLEEAQYGESKEAVDFANAEAIGLAAEEEKEINKAMGLDDNQTGADLSIEDYYGVNPDNPEMKLMSENLKILAALDFEYYLFTRRMGLAGIVLDSAVATKQHTWTVQDALDYRIGEEDEAAAAAAEEEANKLKSETGKENTNKRASK